MPLLVVPVSPEETGLVTLGEWEALLACERVLFERPDHPLIERLSAAGVAAGPLDDEPSAERSGWALVADPGSSRIVELANAGADVAAGAASPPDALTAAHGALVARRAVAAVADLVVVMARLRSVDGCPWDLEQTHSSLAVHLLEEAYEVLDAIGRGETGEPLEEELGDVLLQVVFHSELARQDGRFDVADVSRRLVAKLVHRHPHVFGTTSVTGAAEVLRNWDALKSEEKRRHDPFDGIPAELPALLAASKTQKRALSLGFDADAAGARARVAALLDEALEGRGGASGGGDGASEVVGDALFWLSALASALGVEPESALRAAVQRFRARHR